MRVLVEYIGKNTVDFISYCGGLFSLFFASSYWFTKIVSRQVRFQLSNLFFQMVRVGVNSIPIVALVLLFVGMILAFQLSGILKDFGVLEYVANVISVSIFRELGPLLACIVMSGFVGASFAAEIGTMVVGEEVEALRTQAIDPVRFLVVPRLLATMIMVPCLVILGDLIGVLGGFIIGTTILDIGPVLYWNKTLEDLTLSDFFQGLIKSEVFAIIITLIACYEGFKVKGGAEGVGKCTTITVVLSIVFIIVADCYFAALFYYIW
ncbi:MAG: ABC transporter permease [Candidatus Hydrogenedentota bacterium]